ncbi:Ig-like domain-containing protein [Cellvibrio fibrivorans]|uniref:Ca2+-binding RTX toxin-like protein n=1 Tax=Cellvibrio fibrivorans TaxID=126350 RepID=A0ABU1UYE0_9GAMM|nr:Ig-like domain-containing protein [Cellvibrio fibrivorans]MDR7090211.1 Ca2+-binding RTX toxin-like protein [Cellvibrio fibrivorans]
MSITLEQAKSIIEDNNSRPKTPEELRNLINQIDVAGSGNVTVLYSGGFGVNTSAEGIAIALANSDSNIRIVNNVDAAKFLDYKSNSTLLELFDAFWSGDDADPDIRGSEANKFLFDVNYGGELGAWATVSKNFVSSPATSGNVRVIAPFADPNRVFAEVELKELLNNPNVSEVDGKSKADYQRLAADANTSGRSGHSVVLSAIVNHSGESVSRLQIPTDKAGVVQTIDKTPVAIGTEHYFNDRSIAGQPIPEGMTASSATNVIITARGDDKVAIPKNIDPNTHLENSQFANEQMKNYANEQKAAAIAAGDSVALAKAEKALNKLGIAGDAIALGFAINEANAAYDAGDTNKAIDTMTKWGLEFSGGLAGGVAAAALASSVLAPMYLMGPVGIVVAGGLSFLAGIAGGVLGGDAFVKVFGSMLGLDDSELPSPPPPPVPGPTPASPLVLDLDGDGIELTGMEAGVYFDFQSDTFKELTGWVSADDGLLVLDRNKDGMINTGYELFGNSTVAPVGTSGLETNGFTALARLDGNRDGHINSTDRGFSDLRVWRDLNQNGESETNELFELDAVGIKDIGLDYTSYPEQVDRHGNVLDQVGSYETTSGNFRNITDVWFATNPTISKAEIKDVPLDIRLLPDAVGFGKSHSLHQAMVRDTSGALKLLVKQFVTTPLRSERLFFAEQIIFAWTGQFGALYDPYYQSPVDSRRIVALEAFYGYAVDSPKGSGLQYAQMYNQYFADLVDTVFYQLSSQAHLARFFNEITWSTDNITKKSTGDFSGLFPVLLEYVATHSDTAMPIIADLIQSINGVNPYDNKNITTLIAQWNLFKSSNDLSDYEPSVINAITSGMSYVSPFLENEYVQKVYGTAEQDDLYGLLGNSKIFADAGDDILTGKEGDDILSGGAGDDTYVYNKGDGLDLIINLGDSSDSDIIKFGSSIIPDDIKVERLGRDLNIVIAYQTDEIRIANYFSSDAGDSINENAINQIMFSGDEVWDRAKIKSELFTYTDSNDKIVGFSVDDLIIGGGGNDSLLGFDGNDTIYGGKDFDLIDGGAGDDVFVFESGDGVDVITDVNGFDTIKLGSSIVESDVSLQRFGSKLEITFTSGDEIRVNNMFNSTTGAKNADSGIERIEFANGNTWDLARIQQAAIKGTIGTDHINGFDTNDTINGGKGDDYLQGAAGNDVYLFNLGDGRDDIYDTGGVDIIKFGVGITKNDLKFHIDSGYVDINIGSSDSIHLSAVVSSEGIITLPKVVEKIEFFDGSFLDVEEAIRESINNPSVSMHTFDAEYYYGLDSGDVMTGSTGADYIYALNGNDTIQSGSGRDVIHGGKGNDVYRFNIGDGPDFIETGTGFDSIELGANITEAQVSIGTGLIDSSDVVITIDTGETITVSGMFDTTKKIFKSDYSIDSIKFSGGAIWDQQKILEELLKSKIGVTIVGTVDNDLFSGTTLNDTLTGGDANDFLNGGNGSDSLTGDSGNDTLIGEYGADKLLGGNGDDHLRGGMGYDSLDGGVGNDIYYIDQSDGIDTVDDSGGFDILRLGTGITAASVTVKTDGYRTSINYGSNNSVVITNMFDYDGNITTTSIESIEFSDGEIWSFEDIKAHLSYASTKNNDDLVGFSANDILDGGLGNDYLNGRKGDDTLLGGKGNDVIYGEDGNDILVGGSGNDRLFGGAGSNSYFFNLGDGSDAITLGTYLNTIILGAGIEPDNVIVRSNGDGYYLHFNATDQIFISGFSNNFQVEFSEGTTWSVSEVERRSMLGTDANDNITGPYRFYSGSLYGYDGDDVLEISYNRMGLLDGGAGNDTLKASNGNDSLHGGMGDDLIVGGNGDDVYTFSRGDGKDKIIDESGDDRIEFGVGVTVNDLIFTRNGSDLILSMNTGDEIKIFDTFNQNTGNFNLTRAIESIRFVDGTNLNQAWIMRELSGLPRDLIAPLTPTATFDSAGRIISGFAEAGSFITVKNAYGHSIGIVQANLSNGSFSIDTGSYFLNFQAFTLTSADEVGNISNELTLHAPDVTPPDQPTATFNSTGTVIEGLAEAGSLVIIKNNANIEIGSALADSVSGAFSMELFPALTNRESVSVIAQDISGNSSSAILIKAPDLTPPPQPTAEFNATGKVITGIAEAGSTVVVKNSTNSVTLKSVVADATTGAYSITLTTALINKETVNVTAKDAAGNISAIKAIIAPDKTAPTIPTASFDPTGKIITGVAEAGSTVSVKNAGGTELKTAVANATTGAYTITLTTALINKETVNVTAKDAAGNISAIKAIIAPDKTAPTIPTASFDPTGKVITGVAEAGSTVSVTNAGGTVLKTAVANATTGAYTITLTTALINKETVNVTAKDTAGNISAIRAIIAPDKTAPTIPTASFDPTGKIITGVAEAGSTVSIKNAAGTELKTAIANATTGAYTITLTTALINKETVNVTAKDAAGNISAIKAIVAPDKTAPLAPTASIDTSRKIITGTAEPGSVVEVKNTAGTKLGQFTAHATTGAYTITLGTALAINQTVNVTAKDAAGNVSPIRPVVAPAMANKMLARPQFANNLGILETVAAYAIEKASLAAFGNHTETVIASATSDSFAATLPDNRDRYISGNVDINALIQAMASFEPAVGVDMRNRIASVDQHQVILATSS